jgi:hypothetical protein
MRICRALAKLRHRDCFHGKSDRLAFYLARFIYICEIKVHAKLQYLRFQTYTDSFWIKTGTDKLEGEIVAATRIRGEYDRD